MDRRRDWRGLDGPGGECGQEVGSVGGERDFLPSLTDCGPIATLDGVSAAAAAMAAAAANGRRRNSTDTVDCPVCGGLVRRIGALMPISRPTKASIRERRPHTD
uniref:Uncharacterized protein n=1 Tax=Plectus sambesii TaxID=2011161 RepID=A0A914VWL4_9BILA